MDKTALPRRHFNRARLVSLLAGPGEPGTAGEAPRADFAERLGRWLGVADAIALHAALAPARPGIATGAPAAAPDVALAAVRTALAAAIVDSCAANSGSRRRFPLPRAGQPAALAADFEPVRRFHLALQRDMEAQIGPLRAAVRAVLATGGPRLRRLAALDAVFDQAVGGHERRVLSAMCGLFEQRFAARREAHRAACAAVPGEAGAATDNDNPAAWLAPGGWLAACRDDLCELLLAELDLRLLPVSGLVEAWCDEMEGKYD